MINKNIKINSDQRVSLIQLGISDLVDNLNYSGFDGTQLEEEVYQHLIFKTSKKPNEVSIHFFENSIPPHTDEDYVADRFKNECYIVWLGKLSMSSIIDFEESPYFVSEGNNGVMMELGIPILFNPIKEHGVVANGLNAYLSIWF